MDCRIPRSEYVGKETFEGPDYLTYNKVKVTSNWNQVCLCLYKYNTTDNIYESLIESIASIDTGEYSYDELLNTLYNCVDNLVQDINNTYLGINYQHQNLILQNILDFDVNQVLSEFTQDIDQVYITDSLDIPINDFYFDFNISTFPEEYICLFKQVDNGIDKILPFTLPIPTFKELNNTISNILYSYFLKDYKLHIIIFNHPSFFNLIWLNEYYFTTTTQEDIFDLSNSIYTFEQNECNLMITNGIYSRFGILMNMMLQVWNVTMNNGNYKLSFIPTIEWENNYTQIFQITGKFDVPLIFNDNNVNIITNEYIYDSTDSIIAIHYDITEFFYPSDVIYIPSSGLDCVYIYPSTDKYTCSQILALPDFITFHEDGYIYVFYNYDFTYDSKIIETIYPLIIECSNGKTYNLTISVVPLSTFIEYPVKNIFTINEEFTIKPITNNIINEQRKFYIGSYDNYMTYCYADYYTGEITGKSEKLIRYAIPTELFCIHKIKYKNAILYMSLCTKIYIYIKDYKYNVYIVDNIFHYEHE